VSSVFGSFSPGRRARISRGQDPFNVSLPRRAGVELRQGSEVDVRRCRNAAPACIHDEPVDPTDARKATVRRFGRSDRSTQIGGK
jgi:hypothetical protein